MEKARAHDTTAQKLQASSSWSADRGSTVPLSSACQTPFRATSGSQIQGSTSTRHIWECRYTISIAYFGEKNNPCEAYDGNVRHIRAAKTRSSMTVCREN